MLKSKVFASCSFNNKKQLLLLNERLMLFIDVFVPFGHSNKKPLTNSNLKSCQAQNFELPSVAADSPYSSDASVASTLVASGLRILSDSAGE